jgi:hypothetical protein
MTDTKNIENLLGQVHTISESYKRVSEATGENFNVFSVLGIEHYEESTHSLFLAELLNTNGSHGFKDEFLRLFIEIINIEKKVKTENAKVYVEHFVGYIDKKLKKGGRIDILIEDESKNRIIIENKIYAGEQANQLERYYNFDKNADILFLSLYGENSINHTHFNKYVSISYKHDIINWLEKCQQKAVDNPVVRETIKQYKNLVKKITNQNINIKMENDLIKLITTEGKKENFESFLTLVNLQTQVYKVAVKEHLYPTLDLIVEELKLEEILDREILLTKGASWLGFSFINPLFEKLNLRISFSFNVSRGAKQFIFGYTYINPKIKSDFNYQPIQNLFFEYFGGKLQSDGWLAFKNYDKFHNWENLNTLKDIIHGDFKEDFKNKVKIMTDIINHSFKEYS